MRAALLEAAWDLAHEVGLAGLSQRALADRVDLAQPSFYSYFSSKNDLYDAMYADANETLLARVEALELPADPKQALKAASREVIAFAVEDPVRNQLLFQRTLPGFEPSPESYALAVRFYEWFRANLERAGVHGQDYMDIFVAVQSGLGHLQLANEPGGDRWIRHLDWVIDMFLGEVAREAGRNR
jgi:AcrR family transcriptional regulator